MNKQQLNDIRQHSKRATLMVWKRDVAALLAYIAELEQDIKDHEDQSEQQWYEDLERGDVVTYD